MPVVGFLHSGSPGPSASALAAFRPALRGRSTHCIARLCIGWSGSSRRGCSSRSRPIPQSAPCWKCMTSCRYTRIQQESVGLPDRRGKDGRPTGALGSVVLETSGNSHARATTIVQLDQPRKRHDRRIDEADLVMVAAHEVGVADRTLRSRARSRRRTRPSRNGLGDEPPFVDRGAPEGSSHRAGRCVPYHASVSSITWRKAAPPYTS